MVVATRGGVPVSLGEIAVVRDSSIMTRESVHDLSTTLIIGGILTVLIVFLSLDSWRSTVITGLTLPISVISSFIAMHFLGMSLNVMTFMALSPAIGLLIDDAIVVRENLVRHLEMGQDHMTAARKGTAEIGLVVLFVYLILTARLESSVDPLSIMLSLPLSIVGMAGMLARTGDTLSIMSLIGLILLMGLVTKNAILLVDDTRGVRKGGMERREALITAGRTRLRPIMMTTLATIFGMLPLVLGLGQGAEMRAPLGRAVIGGLLTSTVLTFLVVPVVSALFDDLAAWRRRRWAKASALAQEALGHSGKIAVHTATATALLLALLAPRGPALGRVRLLRSRRRPARPDTRRSGGDRRGKEPRRREGAQRPGPGPRDERRGTRRGAPEPLGRRS